MPGGPELIMLLIIAVIPADRQLFI